MSKIVDMDHPEEWSDDDIRYLNDRGLLPAGYKAQLTQQVQGDTNAVTASAEPSDGISLEDMTGAQLKKEAKARDLPVGGSKQDLIDRIREHDEANATSGDDEELIVEEQ